MCKLFFTVVILLFVCGNLFSQTKNNILEDISSKKICYVGHFSRRTLSRHLNMHERRFKRKWKKYNILLGKPAINAVFNGMERYYVPQFVIARIDSTEIWLKPAKKAISDIIFVYGNHYLGDYSCGRCKTMTRKHIRNDYRNAFNYGVPNSHYLTNHIDKDFLLDYFEKGFLVFSICNLSDGNNCDVDFWFSTNEYDNLIKFQKSDIWKLVLRYDSNSEFKSKFY